MSLDRALKNRKNLVAREIQTSGEVLRAFEQSYFRIQGMLADTLDKIERSKANGSPVDVSFLFERNRLEKILKELEIEGDRLASELGGVATNAQKAGVAAAKSETRALFNSPGFAELAPDLTGLDSGAMRELVGRGSNGDALSRLFARHNPTQVAAVKDALITGVAAGFGANKIASEIKAALGISTAHALTIARTESTGAYRESTRQIYAQNKKVSRLYSWVSSRDLRTCPICWALHGRTFPTSEKFASHPNCRCTLILLLPGAKPLETGVESFAKLTPAQQREILGAGRFELYKAGTHGLDDFVEIYKSDFGFGRRLKSVASLRPQPSKPSKPIAPKQPASPVAKPTNAGDLYDFKTYQDAEKFLEAKFPDIVFDFKGTAPGVLNPSVKAFDELAREYPEVAERLKYFGTYKTKEIPYRTGQNVFQTTPPKSTISKRIHANFRGGEIAHASVDGLRIGINPKYYGDEKAMLEQLATSAATGFKSKARIGRPESTLIHEWGHQVDNLFKREATQTFGIVRADGSGTLGDVYARHRAKYKATETGVSRYATRNKDEGFAEMFLETRITDPSAWSPEVKGFDKLLKGFEKYKNRLVEYSKAMPFSAIKDPGNRARELDKIKSIYKDFGLDFDKD